MLVHMDKSVRKVNKAIQVFQAWEVPQVPADQKETKVIQGILVHKDLPVFQAQCFSQIQRTQRNAHVNRELLDRRAWRVALELMAYLVYKVNSVGFVF